MSKDISGDQRRQDLIRWRFPVAAFILLVSLSCLYGGTWENNSRNWKRAFGSEPPQGITVVNSWYWRSAHWTLEYEYFFEVEVSDEMAQEIVSSDGLYKLDTLGDLSNSLYFHEKPEWFAPKPVTSYDIYMYTEGTIGASGHFIIFVDRESRHLFLSDYQV